MEIPYLDVEFCEGREEDLVKEYVEVIRPDWKGRTFVFKTLAKGHLNINLLCYPSDQAPENGIVFRTSNHFFCGPIDPIHKTVKFMTRNGLGAKVSALFKNGYCMEYVGGVSLDWRSARLYEKEFWPKVAEKLAFWHSKKVTEKAVKQDIRHISVMSEQCAENYDLALESERFQDHRNSLPSSREILDAEERIVRSMKDDLNLVFCHMDLNHSNFIVDENNEVQFVDYDFSGLSYLERDIAWFLRSFADLTRENGQTPGQKYEMDFLEHYLKCRKLLDSEPEPQELDVRHLHCQVEKAKLLVDLRLVVITVLLHFVYGGEEKMIDTCKNYYWGKLGPRMAELSL